MKDKNYERKISILDWGIIISALLLILVIYLPQFIWQEEGEDVYNALIGEYLGNVIAIKIKSDISGGAVAICVPDMRFLGSFFSAELGQSLSCFKNNLLVISNLDSPFDDRSFYNSAALINNSTKPDTQ